MVIKKTNNKKLEHVGRTQNRGHGGQGGRIHAHRRREQIKEDGKLAKRLQHKEMDRQHEKEIALKWLRKNANTELELKRLLETPSRKKDTPSRSPPKKQDYRKGGSKQREHQEKENERRRQRLRQEEIEVKRKQAQASGRGPEGSNRRSRSVERFSDRSRSLSLSRSRSLSPSSTVSDRWEEKVKRIVREVVVEVTSRNKEDKTKRWLPDTPAHLVAKGKALQYVPLADLRKKRPGVKPPEEKEVAESHGMELVLRTTTGSSHTTDKSKVKWAEWSLLFAELIDLYCVKGGHPEVLEEMLTHQRLILTFVHQRIFTAESCVEYDGARRSAPGAQGKGFSWSFDVRFTILKEYKPEYQNLNFLNKKKRGAKSIKSGAQVGVCFDWAEGKICSRSDCKWQHECKTCKLKTPQRHAMIKCPDREKLRELAKKRKRT